MTTRRAADTRQRRLRLPPRPPGPRSERRDGPFQTERPAALRPTSRPAFVGQRVWPPVRGLPITEWPSRRLARAIDCAGTRVSRHRHRPKSHFPMSAARPIDWPRSAAALSVRLRSSLPRFLRPFLPARTEPTYHIAAEPLGTMVE